VFTCFVCGRLDLCSSAAYNLRVAKFLAFITLLAGLAVGAAWYSQRGLPWLTAREAVTTSGVSTEWLEHLYSQNPRDVEAAEQEVRDLGANAIPTIRSTLNDPRSEPEARKAALKACVVLGQTSAPAIPDVAAHLGDPEVTEEAALALSFMGREAFGPLRGALTSEDPVVRREALRSLGKLKTRAPLDSRAVLPILVRAMRDDDKEVRTVAATYLGIIHEDPEASVPVLVGGLTDADIEVRRASATALGSFPQGAESAVPELRNAAKDRDEDLAREAGIALIKLQKR
jgi:HEAT repeat protein